MSPLEQGKEIWTRLPIGGRVMTIGAAVATLALIASVVYFGSRDEYSVLFSDLKPENASVIVEKLNAENVPYSLTNGGTAIQIPTNRISEMRLKLAGAGVLSGGHVGFDLFDKSSFGATDFAQQVNYRRAIEGELARTLEGMDEVESARVHVTPKKESVFADKEEGAKASVMLRIKQGKTLAGERTDAIVALVTSSVEGLDPSSVSVLDARGRLLTGAITGKNGKSDAGTFSEQLDSRRKFEAETAARVVALIEPVTGDGGVRADVSADVDFSQVERTEEKYDPQSQVVRSQRTASEKSAESATSVPNNLTGVRANDPSVPAPQQQLQNQKNGNDERAATTTNYEIDRILTKTIGGGGRVTRLNVSVVVDHKMVNNNRVARTAQELQQIEKLVAAAVGTDAQRGDSVVVQTMPFDKGDAGEAVAASFFSNNKDLIATAIKYGGLALVTGLLLFFVFRPARKALKAAMPEPEQKLLDGEKADSADGEDGERRLDGETSADKEEEKQLPESTEMLTVGELEAKLDEGEEPVLTESEDELLALNPHDPIQQLERMRQIMIDGSDEEAEVMVGALRGWIKNG